MSEALQDSETEGFDLIGDIHGHADALEQLLTRLGYAEAHGVWSHPVRQVIFLGDFVDRGPSQVRTVAIARAMVEAGSALAVMGNHEFNAVAWATEDPECPGSYLRPHTAKNRGQHQRYLDEVGVGSAIHQAHIHWFRSLPVYLDLQGIRVIHACWHKQALDTLKPYLDARKRIRPESWPVLTRPDAEPFEALETVLKGLEIKLPDGAMFHDKDGNPRTEIRTRWWETGRLSYRDLAMAPPSVIERIPHTPAPADLLPGYDGDKPLFVGHYWLSGTPEPLTPHIACLDYSIAATDPKIGRHGKLCAYRWSGEASLQAARLVWVEGGVEPRAAGD